MSGSISQITMRLMPGCVHERSRRHARAESDDEHRLRIVIEQRRDVAEHPLQPHVLRQARRLDLAGDVEVARAARFLGHGDRRVHPFADVQILRLASCTSAESGRTRSRPSGTFGTVAAETARSSTDAAAPERCRRADRRARRVPSRLRRRRRSPRGRHIDANTTSADDDRDADRADARTAACRSAE